MLYFLLPMCYSRLRKAVSVNVLFITCSYDFGGIIMDHFKLVSEYAPTGDQPQAIAELVEGFREGNQFETLLGVTGSGKTFTMANVIQELNKPTLIIAHNTTLASQL